MNSIIINNNGLNNMDLSITLWIIIIIQLINKKLNNHKLYLIIKYQWWYKIIIIKTIAKGLNIYKNNIHNNINKNK